MSKELKRDKNGRFVSKTANVGVEVEVKAEMPKFKDTKEEVKYWKTVARGYKKALEDVSSMYLNKCVDYKALERKHRFAIDAIVLACVQLGWLTRKLSWWTRRKHHDEILDMQMELDTVVWKAKYADAK